jgi:3-methylfumaryl-CoA hydratase
VDARDYVDLDRAQALAGLLDRDPGLLRTGDLLRPMWHLGYLLPRPAQRDLGKDGHPRTPHGAQVRRMFAGGRVELRPGIRLGDDVTARSEVVGEREKVGRSGRLVFVTSRTTIAVAGVDCLVDERDVVYVDSDPAAPTTRTGGDMPEWPDPRAPRAGEVQLDPTLLFRFSALTYNAHRVHYDVAYTRDVEGYPGLLVHGPLQALLMAEAASDVAIGPLGTVHPADLDFEYQLVAPLFLGQGLVVTTKDEGGGVVTAVTEDASGRVTAHGSLRLRPQLHKTASSNI